MYFDKIVKSFLLFLRKIKFGIGRRIFTDEEKNHRKNNKLVVEHCNDFIMLTDEHCRGAVY